MGSIYTRPHNYSSNNRRGGSSCGLLLPGTYLFILLCYPDRLDLPVICKKIKAIALKGAKANWSNDERRGGEVRLREKQKGRKGSAHTPAHTHAHTCTRTHSYMSEFLSQVQILNRAPFSFCPFPRESVVSLHNFFGPHTKGKIPDWATLISWDHLHWVTKAHLSPAVGEKNSPQPPQAPKHISSAF